MANAANIRVNLTIRTGAWYAKLVKTLLYYC